MLVSCLAVSGLSRRVPQLNRPGQNREQLAGQARDILRKHCFDCHGKNPKKLKGGLNLFDPAHLADKERKIVVPGAPDESELIQQVEKDLMPPPAGNRPAVTAEERKVLRQWVASGAAPFPATQPPATVQTPRADAPGSPETTGKSQAGSEYVLTKILAHVRSVPRQDRPLLRYFSIHHLLTAGLTPDDLELQRDALAKAIHHLTWNSKIIKLKPIDPPARTVFVIDLRELGWDLQPYERIKDRKSAGKSELTLFDLVLLEYPYSIAYSDSDTADQLAEEFLQPAGQVRPIPYIRADWFVSTATQSPLYEDLLQLPFDLKALEARLEVDAEKNLTAGLALRAGMTTSNVSRNNRVVERHPLPRAGGAYWKSFDFRTSKGIENMLKDPIHLHPTGGEFIFTLPNGLQGYFISDARGNRLESAPTDIVIDRFASDKIVRNGLACMRCHDAGMKDFADSVRPALEKLPDAPGFDRQTALKLYPGDKILHKLVAADGQSFLKAMKEVLGKDQVREPLIPVSQRFLDRPLSLPVVAGELGLAPDQASLIRTTGDLETVFRLPQFSRLGLATLAARGEVKRDAWEDYYDQVVRHLGLGMAVVPLDGHSRRDYPAGPAPFKVELTTNKKTNVFQPGDTLFVFVANQSPHTLDIELIGSGTRGGKKILASGVRVGPGQTFQHPPQGKPGIPISPRLGKEQITLFASDTEFPAGELLRGKGVASRVVHPFFGLERKDGRVKVTGDLTRLMKKTIDIETR